MFSVSYIRVMAREQFLARCDPPWECYFCGDPICSEGQKPWSLNIHHVDGDISNADESNIVSAHFDCHSSHHHSGYSNGWLDDMWKRSEFRRKMREAVIESNRRRSMYYQRKV